MITSHDPAEPRDDSDRYPDDPLEPYGCPSCRNEPCRCPDLDTCSVEELDAEIKTIPIRMTPEDQACFAEAILNPPPIAPALTRAFERHQVLVGSPVTHGVNCPKKPHIGTGHLHSEDDDSPYPVDGVSYCGRCHTWLSKEDM